MGGRVERPEFSPKFYRELAQDNPFGLTIHWREAEAWFLYIAWPAYKTYKYTQHQRAVRRWWARATQGDLARARDARENARMEGIQAQQDELDAQLVNEDTTPHDDTLRVIFGG
jgi:hypothetical protein